MATTTKTPEAKSSATTFPTRNDLPAETRIAVIDLCNQQLADLFDLHSQTKYAHWNVKGINFIGLHKLFDELAELVEGAADSVAERATALGGVAKGTARMAVASSLLPEFPTEKFTSADVVDALADRYAAASKAAREGIDQADDLGDKNTADLMTEVSRMLDQSLYFLEAHRQR